MNKKKSWLYWTVFDNKIRQNIKINDNLQQQAFALFEQLLINAGDVECSVADIAHLNPKRALQKIRKQNVLKCHSYQQAVHFPAVGRRDYSLEHAFLEWRYSLGKNHSMS